MLQLQQQQEEPLQKAWNISMEKYPIGFVQLLQLPETNNTSYEKVLHRYSYENHYLSQNNTTIFHPPNLI